MYAILRNTIYELAVEIKHDSDFRQSHLLFFKETCLVKGILLYIEPRLSCVSQVCGRTEEDFVFLFFPQWGPSTVWLPTTKIIFGTIKGE